MAHGLQSVLKQRTSTQSAANNKSGDNNNNNKGGGKTGIGSRRIFPPHFKLQVLDSYRKDSDCKGNQRATARKYGIHRRQIQKWLQAEANLRNSVNNNSKGVISATSAPTAINGGCDLSLSGCCRLRDDSAPDAYYHSSSDRAPRVPCIGQPEAYEPCCGSPQARVHAAAALDYSSSSSNSSLCDMPLSTPPATLLLSPALSPSQYNNNSPSPTLEPHYLDNQYHTVCQPLADEPIDLSLKHLRAISPYAPSACLPVAPLYISTSEDNSRMPDPEVWDLSVRKRTFKQEPNQQQNDAEPIPKRPFKLFKPYLDDNQDSDEEPPAVKPELPNVPTPSINNNNNYVPSAYSTCCPAPSSSTSYYYQPISYPDYSCHPPSFVTCQPPTIPLKQRQSYSVDFKLRAIESYYYGEECCRGNQRAVASKYNVHRRQVQKWLRQEDELRTRNVIIIEPAQMTGNHLPLVR